MQDDVNTPSFGNVLRMLANVCRVIDRKHSDRERTIPDFSSISKHGFGAAMGDDTGFGSAMGAPGIDVTYAPDHTTAERAQADFNRQVGRFSRRKRRGS